MKSIGWLSIIVGCLTFLQPGSHKHTYANEALKLSPMSEKTVSGFAYPESVVYDPNTQALYVGQFGSELKPTLKDGMGKISKVALSGEILEEQFLPAKGGVLNKPKGIWVEDSRLWVTDIDEVWIFDLNSRKGKKAILPNAKFANDLTVINNALFVSDTAGNRIYKVTPADFLEINKSPDVTISHSNLNFSPNGLCPAPDGSILVVAYNFKKQDQGIYILDKKGTIKTLAEKVGLLDGIFRFDDGTLLITDWKSKSLFKWSPNNEINTLAKGFKGPADFCVVPENKGFMVIVPDLFKGELRMIHLQR